MKPDFVGFKSVQGVIHYLNLNHIVQIFQINATPGKEVTTIVLSNGSIDVPGTPGEITSMISKNLI